MLAVAGLILPATVLGALPASVAVVDGKPIPRDVFDHWMFVAAKGDRGANGGTVIVPTDPPRFTGCVAQVRAKIPNLRHASARVVRDDCALLFTNLSRQVLDFLITARWDDAEAAADGIVISAAQVQRTFAVDKRMQFPTRAAFRRYLKGSGETVDDVKFRIRASLIAKALLTTEHLSADALEAELTTRFKPNTSCARYYVMFDCAGG